MSKGKEGLHLTEHPEKPCGDTVKYLEYSVTEVKEKIVRSIKHRKGVCKAQEAAKRRCLEIIL